MAVSLLKQEMPVLNEEDRKKVALPVKTAEHLEQCLAILSFDNLTEENKQTVTQHLQAASRLSQLCVAVMEMRAEFKNWQQAYAYKAFMMPIADQLGTVPKEYQRVKWHTYDRPTARKCFTEQRTLHWFHLSLINCPPLRSHGTQIMGTTIMWVAMATATMLA
jgi:hypothetical protein